MYNRAPLPPCQPNSPNGKVFYETKLIPLEDRGSQNPAFCLDSTTNTFSETCLSEGPSLWFFFLTALFLLLFFFLNLFYLFIYFWLCWVFVAARGLSLVAASGGYSLLRYAGFSLPWLLSCGARALGTRASVVVAHELSCSAACGIFPDQGSNPCPLHWQADSQPLRHATGEALLCDFLRSDCWLAVKGDRIRHPKVCVLGIRIILSWLFLRNGRHRKSSENQIK